MRIETQLIHAGAPRPRIAGSGIVPIFQSSIFEQQPGSSYADLRYPRLSTLPNHEVLHRRIAALENTEAAMVCASGMAAVSGCVLAAVGRGGHLLVQDSLYGGTDAFVHRELELFGMSYDLVDGQDPASWEAKRRPETRAFYTEALSNPLSRVPDHRAVVDFARQHGLTTIIDSTFATPINFRPAEIGYDLVLHSATKYLNGHSDLACGAVAGSEKWIAEVAALQNHLGASLDAHACFLLERGLKTLSLRVERQNANAQGLAEFLNARPQVERVHYAGLKNHPQHARAAELMSGFGGVLAVEVVGGAEAADRLIEGLRLPLHGPSLGGVESLITRPATTSHLTVDPEQRRALGIADGLIRISVGIEHLEDLIDDFRAALDALD